MVVYKYLIGTDSNQKLQMPKNATIIKVGTSQDTLCVWAIVDPHQIQNEVISIDVYWTGEHFNNNKKYVGTSAIKDKIYHVFMEPVMPSEYITIKRDHYINSLEMLLTFFNRADLSAGENKTNELLETAKQL